jgi:sugar/nucleoside kinase (ribokinase family)
LIGDAERPTGTIILLIDEENRRTMLTERGANRQLVPADVTDDLLAAAGVAAAGVAAAGALHFTGYTVFNGASAGRVSVASPFRSTPALPVFWSLG